jgi:phosphatidylinositol alpha-1,6-mannosyltransferase
MRALMISSEFPPGPGGIGNHACHLATHLTRLGWQVTVLSPQDYASEHEVARFNKGRPFRIVTVPSGRGQLREALHRLRVALDFSRQQQPEVLVATGLSGVWVGATLSALRRLPMMAIAHGSELLMPRGLAKAINRCAFGRARAIVAVSQFTARLVERAGIRPQRLEVIPNAADPAEFRVLPDHQMQQFRSRNGLNGAPILLTVGHVSERKGQEFVIRALPEVLKRSGNVHYYMIGLPTLRPHLSELANRLGVAKNVHFLGKVTSEDLLGWLNCCDLFLMTSRTTQSGDCEGFGIAVVEAALCGKPAVVSDQSGLLEAIQNGISGLAVPEGSATATADAISSLLENPAKRQAMGQAALARARGEQTWDTCARKYDRLLRELIAS